MANNLTTEKKVMAVSLLAEGSSIRSIERITGVHRDTVMRLGVRVGEGCKRVMDARMRNLNCQRIEVDEIWGFVGKKKKNVTSRDSWKGDAWTFIAIDADTKLIPSFLVGRRENNVAREFLRDLESRLANRVQLSTDSMRGYVDAVETAFGADVDYGQVVKTYSVVNLSQPASGRYSPADVVKIERTAIIGSPEMRNVSTSHIEKQNHTLRMHCRRLTRLTNAFSKKWENFEAAVALSFGYYNFCKKHTAINCTPAMEAGVESSQWTVAELLERCGE